MDDFENHLLEDPNQPCGQRDSSEIGSATVRVESVSGTYMELARQGKLLDLVKLQQKREHLSFELLTVEAGLSQFARPVWLLNFFIETGGEQYIKKLERKAASLERKKKKLAEEIAGIEDRIRKIEPLILEFQQTLPKIDSGIPSSPFLTLEENFDAFVLVRDLIIQQCSNKGYGDERICGTLDDKLEIPGRPPGGINEAWIEKYGQEWAEDYPAYNFYLAAYKDVRTKNAMQTMISKAKKRIR